MDDATGESDAIADLPVDEAVERVAATDPERDRDAVRAALERVAEDGVVTAGGVEAAIADLSQVVATPENRVELAARELAEARDAAEPVADLGAVRSRLAGFESRLARLETRTDELRDDLGDLLDRRGDPGSIYEVARGIRDLTRRANDVHRDADELIHDLDRFERWLATPGRRVDELAADVDGVAGSIDELATDVDDIAEQRESARAWLDATLRSRVLSLLVDDLRAEYDDLLAWAEREGFEEPDAGIEDRLDDLDVRLDALGDRLDDAGRSEWRERHRERIDGFEAALDRIDPPVDWGEVHGVLEEYRP